MVAEVAKIGDPAERLRSSTALLTELQDGVTETARVRRETIAQLRGDGQSLAVIADLIGVSRARIVQLRTAGPPPERAFLGAGHLTIGVTQKTESVPSRPVIAKEDFAAAHQLEQLARDLQLEASFEYIPEDGAINLNRDNLIVICGPRISPPVRATYETDPIVRWEHDAAGWYLTDKRTGQHYRSPADDPQKPRPGDVAYLGRLPRPDGAGTVLLLAGVHSVGSHGVVDFLSRHLPELYDEVGTGSFSAIMACEYDDQTREITHARLLTPLYQHGK
jgi:hypothetical protein